MEPDRAPVTSRKAKAQGRTPSCIRSRSLDRHPLCTPQWHSLGDAPQGDGLRQRYDLLAPPSRLAARRRLGSPPPSLIGSLGPSQSHRLEPCLHRHLDCPLSRGGEKTGKNPTDRGKQGTKRHIIVDRKGIPLTIQLTAANVNDTTRLEQTVDAINPIKGPRGRPRKRPVKLHADKGYESKKNKAALRRRGITPRIARKGVESKERLGRHRWVVERTQSWLNRFRRLKVRYERRADIYEAFLKIGCALICLKFIERPFC
jgi:transposase